MPRKLYKAILLGVDLTKEKEFNGISCRVKGIDRLARNIKCGISGKQAEIFLANQDILRGAKILLEAKAELCYNHQYCWKYLEQPKFYKCLHPLFKEV